jgi:hypothetical protein
MRKQIANLTTSDRLSTREAERLRSVLNELMSHPKTIV